MFKCKSENAPKYLLDIVKVKKQYRLSLRSEENCKFNYEIPFCRSNQTQRSFAYQGPTHWNSLPLDLKTVNDIKIFKKQLKTYLFSKF